MSEALKRFLREPPATLLVLPNGWVKASAALPDIVADLRRQDFEEAWAAYRVAWRSAVLRNAVLKAIANDAELENANRWRLFDPLSV